MRSQIALGLCLTLVVLVFLRPTPSLGETNAEKISELEGILKVHPKFLYRYYVTFGDGQTCALYGVKRDSNVPQLKGIEVGTRVRLRGTLGTYHFEGGSKDNPSPFPSSWVMYMEVREAKVVK